MIHADGGDQVSGPVVVLVEGTAVTEKGFPAALKPPAIELVWISGAVLQEVKQHIFVVPDQRHPMRMLLEVFPHHLDDAPALRTTVDVITEEDHCVTVGIHAIFTESRQQFDELPRMTMDITDGIETFGHHGSCRASRTTRLDSRGSFPLDEI